MGYKAEQNLSLFLHFLVVIYAMYDTTYLTTNSFLANYESCDDLNIDSGNSVQERFENFREDLILVTRGRPDYLTETVSFYLQR